FFTSIHASPLEIFWHLRVPNAVPYLFASMRLCVSLSLIGAVVGELVGAREGLGRLIESAATSLLTTTVFSAVIILTLLGVVAPQACSLVELRLICWPGPRRANNGPA